MARKARKAAAKAENPATEFDPAQLQPQPANTASQPAIPPAAQSAIPAAEPPAREPGEEGPEEPARNGITRKQYKPAKDPFSGVRVKLSHQPAGMEAQLSRSNENRAMVIQFSEQPGPEVTTQLRDAGFGWEGRVETDFGRGAWYIKLEPGKEWQNHAHAEKVFQQAVNHIRASNGMEPFVPGAVQTV